MKELNLCKILKGHEGETFYSHSYGEVVFSKICQRRLIFFKQRHSKDINRTEFSVSFGGRIHGDGEIDIFPTKNNRDWNKWIEKQSNKIPKTWNEYEQIFNIDSEPTLWFDSDMNWDKIGNSCSALFKIYQLIEAGYGGNVTKEEWLSLKYVYQIVWDVNTNGIHIISSAPMRFFGYIAFHTKQQAEEFLSRPENVQLLKDYFMI